jgi:hypothetical protein
MLAEDIEEYLAPIYRSEAEFVICLLSSDYPKRIWTKFESEQFKDRFKDGEVIPVWFSDAPVGIFDETSRKCGFTYDPKKNMESQVTEFVEILRKKVSEKRMEENS